METTTTKNRVRRFYSHPLTREGTVLRFNPETGTVSRPERAGTDVGPFVHVRGADLETCRAAWRAAELALLAEGFVAKNTETY